MSQNKKLLSIINNTLKEGLIESNWIAFIDFQNRIKYGSISGS